MAQYKLAHIDMKGNRGELHDLLNLTGAEVSCNTLPQARRKLARV